MTPISRRIALTGLASGTALLMTGCAPDTPRPSGNSGTAGTPGVPPTEKPKVDANRHQVVVRTSTSDMAVPATAEGSLTACQALISAATAVVVVKDAKPASADLTTANAVAKALGVPMLIDGPGLAAELDRLQTRVVVGYPAEGLSVGSREVVAGPASADQLPKLDGLPRTPEESSLLGLTDGTALTPAIEATLAAAGVKPMALPAADPGVNNESVAAVKEHTKGVVGVGTAFGASQRFAAQLETARTAVEMPGGGTSPFPGRHMIALYGHPSGPALGMLGEQPPAQAVARLKKYVEQYQAVMKDQTVIGAFEIITTVASAGAGKDGDYSYETPIEELEPWVKAAEDAGFYVVLDLQPGRTDFLTQAKLYEPLLKRPTVGLALDPEWRLKPNEKHLVSVGQVGVDEVNKVGAWLADLVKANKLPPKVLTLHQFQVRMITDRQRLDTSRYEVQYLVHVDGQGGQAAKQGTWGVLKKNLPPRVYMGWKNFEHEDKPMLTPAQTIAQVHPTPFFISYQ